VAVSIFNCNLISSRLAYELLNSLPSAFNNSSKVFVSVSIGGKYDFKVSLYVIYTHPFFNYDIVTVSSIGISHKVDVKDIGIFAVPLFIAKLE